MKLLPILSFTDFKPSSRWARIAPPNGWLRRATRGVRFLASMGSLLRWLCQTQTKPDDINIPRTLHALKIIECVSRFTVPKNYMEHMNTCWWFGWTLFFHSVGNDNPTVTLYCTTIIIYEHPFRSVIYECFGISLFILGSLISDVPVAAHLVRICQSVTWVMSGVIVHIQQSNYLSIYLSIDRSIDLSIYRSI